MPIVVGTVAVQLPDELLELLLLLDLLELLLLDLLELLLLDLLELLPDDALLCALELVELKSSGHGSVADGRP
jgi:hypothetical protein